MRSMPLLAGSLVFVLGGCLSYNEECARYVTDPDGVAGWLDGNVAITKNDVRTKDNSIGQLVAEAYYHAFDDQADKYKADLAVVNGGAIRSEGVCETREVLTKGALKRKVLRDILPFDNRVVVVSVTHHQLKNIFEHSIGGYSTTDPRGSFLQIYGAEVSVDCSQPAESLNPDGTRATEGRRVTRILLRQRDGTTREIPLSPPSDTETVRVAIDSFLQGGGDGFSDFEAVDANETLSAGSFNFEIVAHYFAGTYPQSKPLSATPAERMKLTGCK